MNKHKEASTTDSPTKTSPLKSSKNVLLCGGSGLIGQAIRKELINTNHNPLIFTRKSKAGKLHWNPEVGYLNPDIFKSSQVIINLAGSGIVDKRWTKKQKKELFNSRIQSTQLIYHKLSDFLHKPEVYIHFSAIGFYPQSENGNTIMDENSPPGNGFLAHLAWSWEEEARKIAALGIRTVILRTGIVLSNKGGAFSKMLRPFQFYAGTQMGGGQQIMSWIHINDLCQLILYIMDNKKCSGIYNAVSPYPISNHSFSKAISQRIKKPILLPNLPASMLRLTLGERAKLLLTGTHASAKKVLELGFRFRYPKIENALKELLPNG